MGKEPEVQRYEEMAKAIQQGKDRNHIFDLWLSGKGREGGREFKFV